MTNAGWIGESHDPLPLRFSDEELRAICEEAIARGKALEQAERANIVLRIRRMAREVADVCSAVVMVLVGHG